MTKVKDVLHKCKWWFCGAAIVGSSYLYLSQQSKFRQDDHPKKEKVELASMAPTKFLTKTLRQDRPEEKQKLIGYSMEEAFKYGVINSISDYVERAPYKVDTVKFAGDFNQVITYGYHQKINGRNQVVLSHIEPDTISIPNTSARIKRMIVSFAEYHNEETQRNSILAHEFSHQANNPDKEVAKEINLPELDNRSIFDYNCTTEQFAKICAHDEIRSRINQFLYLREQYLENGDLHVFKEDYRFYANAIRSGKIDPKSNNEIDAVNERLFIVKSLHEIWQNKTRHNYEKFPIAKLAEHQPMVNGAKNEYNNALDKNYTFIWKMPDGRSKLVNMNYISDETIPDVRLTERVKQAAASREYYEKYGEYPQEKEPAVKLQTLLNDGGR